MSNCAGATGEEVSRMKIRVTHDFYEYEVSKKRGNYLISFRVAKEIKDQKGGDPKSPAEA